MSYTSLYAQMTDVALMNRVTAATQQEAIENPTAAESSFGIAVRNGYASPTAVLGWPVSVATEAAYEYAINSGNQNPGGDPTVITDEDILSAVQANWPSEWPPVIPPPPDNPPA